jgi:two-component system, NtrC family, response regulator AtoC
VNNEPREIYIEQSEMVGISPIFLQFKGTLKQVAPSNVPILLTGETGTGKELAAKYIHDHSNVAKENLITVDCTLLNDNLFESELFGHEKGAFTSAVKSRKGLFELANRGTLFLDEIGELPLSQQPKLLRALESGDFRRVGSGKTINSKVRVVCATHNHLGDLVKEGKFRSALFYRLSVFSVEIPPLRERKEDIFLLADYFLRNEGHAHQLTPAAITKLTGHSWHGNIRELKNCLQLAVALAPQDEIDALHIHIMRRQSRHRDLGNSKFAHPSTLISNSAPTVHLEKEKINGLIEKFQGNRKRIAAEMGISERTLYRKLNQHELVSP